MINLKKIVELCDIPWIQERWKRKRCDIYSARGTGHFNTLTSDNGGVFYAHPVWLLLGFNPETGNYQLDDLLMEALKYKDGWLLMDDFRYWWTTRQKKCAFHFFTSEIIAKLTWLKELIKELP